MNKTGEIYKILDISLVSSRRDETTTDLCVFSFTIHIYHVLAQSISEMYFFIKGDFIIGQSCIHGDP